MGGPALLDGIKVRLGVPVSQFQPKEEVEVGVVTQIPDLWRAAEDASRLYQLYLCDLQRNGLHERVISACAQIRRYAARGPGREAGLFTFSFELDALCILKNYEGAWRRLRLNEEIALGNRLRLSRRQWEADEVIWFEFNHAPLLYFLERYRQGCSLLEAWLDHWFRGGKVRSFNDVLFRVYNGDEEPANRCRVTLAHFYHRLDKCLREWTHWEAFVDGFHPRLFRLAGVRREALLMDSEHLAPFFLTRSWPSARNGRPPV